MSNSMGRLFIKLEQVVPEIDFKSEQERDEFLDYVERTLYKRMYQAVLTWRGNKQRTDEKAAKEPPPPVPDYVQRERERTRARQGRT